MDLHSNSYIHSFLFELSKYSIIYDFFFLFTIIPFSKYFKGLVDQQLNIKIIVCNQAFKAFYI